MMSSDPSRQPPSQTVARTISHWASRLAIHINRLANWIARHWLLLANLAVGVLYNALPAAPPILMKAGHLRIASLVYRSYSLLCHQLPERSFFLFGPRLTYSLVELERLMGRNVPLRYVGDPSIGYKTAICQRDVATYLAWLLLGIAFAVTGRRWRPISIRTFVLLSVPIAVDGLGQFAGLWHSTVWSRVITGGLFGAAMVLLAYPYIELGMSEVRRTTQNDALGT
jgi:uncharacterized membrane protein